MGKKADCREEGIHMEKENTPIGVAYGVFGLHNRSEAKSADTIRWYDYAIRQMIEAPRGIPESTSHGGSLRGLAPGVLRVSPGP